jgi:hypothetical protein
MRPSRLSFPESTTRVRRGEQGHVRLVIILIVCLLLGFAIGALWHYRRTAQAPMSGDAAVDVGLSASTKAVLQRVDSPVEIRFYSVLDPATTTDSLRAFAGRVDRLLSEFEKEGGGKVNVIRHASPSDSVTVAASADGIRSFNLDKGEPCYLAIVVAQNDQKELLSGFSPDWEPALEADLSRAIARVISPRGANEQWKPPALPPARTEEVRKLIPDPASVTLEEGTKLLREKAMVEFEAATKDMESQLKEAEQRFVQAQNEKSESAQQQAKEQLQRIRSEQMEKVKQIAARLHDQTAALEQLKKQ